MLAESQTTLLEENERGSHIASPLFSGYSHAFDVGVATRLNNVHAAIILNHIRFWLHHNKAHGINQIDGRTWMYTTSGKIAKEYPYFTEKQVKYAIQMLVEEGYLIKGNYNESSFDKTPWYALFDEKLIHSSNNSYEGQNCPIDELKKSLRRTKLSLPADKIVPPIYKDKDIEYKDTKSVSEPAVGLTSFFLEKLKEINPKIKVPNLIKWTQEIYRLLHADKRSEEEVRAVVEYIVEQHKNPKREFTWSKAIGSPEKLRKHFASIWLEMNSKSPERAKEEAQDVKVKTIKENREWAEKLYKKIEPSLMTKQNIYYRIADNCVTLEDKERKIYHPLSYVENGFKDIVEKFLRSRGVL